jgi:hypothetical protein
MTAKLPHVSVAYWRNADSRILLVCLLRRIICFDNVHFLKGSWKTWATRSTPDLAIAETAAISRHPKSLRSIAETD